MKDHILNMVSSEQNYNIKMSISKHFLIYKLFNAVILTSILTLTAKRIWLALRHILWKLLFIFVIESFANMHSNILSINFRFIGFRVFMAIQIVSSIALNIRVIVDYYWVSTEIEHFYMCTGVYMIANSNVWLMKRNKVLQWVLNLHQLLFAVMPLLPYHISFFVRMSSILWCAKCP